MRRDGPPHLLLAPVADVRVSMHLFLASFTLPQREFSYTLHPLAAPSPFKLSARSIEREIWRSSAVFFPGSSAVYLAYQSIADDAPGKTKSVRQ